LGGGSLDVMTAASTTAAAATATAAATTTARPGLGELVDRLRECTAAGADPHDTARAVARVLEEIRPTVDMLSPAERAGSADGYARHTLHAEERFSISAVVWRPGQFTEIHDHLVWCSFMILQGVETETLFGLDGERLVEVGRLRRPAGSVSGVAPPDDIHQVHNTGTDVAITLHVYGADLSTGTSVRRTYSQPG
jgi:predicted metal-dependent enzyme (double-stranded beta helix superfamily)